MPLMRKRERERERIQVERTGRVVAALMTLTPTGHMHLLGCSPRQLHSCAYVLQYASTWLTARLTAQHNAPRQLKAVQTPPHRCSASCWPSCLCHTMMTHSPAAAMHRRHPVTRPLSYWPGQLTTHSPAAAIHRCPPVTPPPAPHLQPAAVQQQLSRALDIQPRRLPAAASAWGGEGWA
jgi:hypothetical protein